MQPQLWLLVGAAGVGRTAFYQQVLAARRMPFISAEHIAQAVYLEASGATLDAVTCDNAELLAQRLALQALQDGLTFCVESTFTRTADIDFVAHAKAAGYAIVLVFIHVDDASLLQARLSQRAYERGAPLSSHERASDGAENQHAQAMPAIPQSDMHLPMLAHIKAAMPLCDEVRVLDNSSLQQPFKPIVEFSDGMFNPRILPLPDWAQALL